MQLPRTAVQALCRAEARAPDWPLLAWRGGRFTVAQFAETARRYARGLRAGGVEPGGHVAVVAANSERFAALWYGIYLAGAVEVPINAEPRGPMLRYVLTDSDPAVVLVESSFAQRVRGLAPSGLRVVELDDTLLTSWETAPPIEEADPRRGRWPPSCTPRAQPGRPRA
jgi:acyl-CoA synthetase (AMP-forming)/AMP-acid ligase II